MSKDINQTLSLKQIIEETDNTPGKIFDVFIQILIFTSVICFSLETLPNLSQEQRDILSKIEVFNIIVFTLEYFLRIFVTDKKFKFIFSFYGLIDLIAIVPFYLSLGVDLQSARIFRFLRLFRVFKMVRYNKALNNFHKAFKSIKEELIVFSIVTLMLIYISAVGIYYFEKDAQPEQFSSIIHSLWWAVATLTTVGYGDVYPVTFGGRVFTFVILMIGIAIIAIPAGLFSSALSKSIKN